MSYTIRNTLILVVLLIAVSALGVYVFSFNLRQEAIRLENDLLIRINELNSLRENNQNFHQIEQSMLYSQDIWKNLPKRLYRIENSVESYAYFNTLASQKDSRLSFNFRKNKLNTVKTNNISHNRYTLVGEARYIDLFRFIWKLENYASLYIIEELEILPPTDKYAREKFGKSAVHFLMTVKSYSMDIGSEELTRQTPVYDMAPVKLNINPFAALISKKLPPNIENLMVVDNSVLLGMSNNEAYLRDPDGKVWNIKRGGKVYLGVLTGIDPDKGLVEFTLSEGGFLRKVTLRMSFKSN
ncbi:MAG: hypothetical protein GY863_06905 [bacterium]|nr:hypothetical protein [bacterium]